jgi:hypothetical protein
VFDNSKPPVRGIIQFGLFGGDQPAPTAQRAVGTGRAHQEKVAVGFVAQGAKYATVSTEDITARVAKGPGSRMLLRGPLDEIRSLRLRSAEESDDSLPIRTNRHESTCKGRNGPLQ